jgi:hypothetical protein
MSNLNEKVVRAQLAAARNDIDQLKRLNLGETRVNSALSSLAIALENLADIVISDSTEEEGASGLTGGGISPVFDPDDRP